MSFLPKLHGLPAFAVEKLKSCKPFGRKLLTLAIVDQERKLLLGEKKRGFGQGYINGFGGKVEEGETIQAAACRELTEEACISAVTMEHQGILTFVFDDQVKPWEVHVFRVPDFTGEPTETEEMKPVWYSHDNIPFHTMWADDPFWYPLFLKRQPFAGLFAFQGNNLVWKEVQVYHGLNGDTRIDWCQYLD